jgi:hypothetical protein
MDPYLEGSLWTTVHAQLIAEIARQLAPRLRPRYIALTTERFVVETRDPDGTQQTSIYPDVGVAQTRHPGSPGAAGGGVAVAPLRLATVMPESVPHFTVEIRDVAERRLVTVIEVLSPTNKRGDGRAEYLARRQRLLLSSTHIVEIDLLHEGRRVPMRDPLPAVPYFVLVSHAAVRPILDVHPIRLQDPLPTIGVPLLPTDGPVPLDVQAAFTNIYDLLGYDLAVDYTRPHEITLPPPEAAWVEEHLLAAGLRNGPPAPGGKP